ncbi:MAG: hypothetical protein H0U63_03300, partial [Burkholderiales bacterium]|nr:hypothetical protein [Burkholderiales bacterium]
MNWIFSPAVSVLLPMSNKIKMTLAGILFTVPLAIALLAPPLTWPSAEAIAIVATFAFAWYLLWSVYLAGRNSWSVVDELAKSLSERNLQDHHFTEAGRRKMGAGQLSRLLGTLSQAQANLRDMVSQMRQSADAARTAADEIAAGNMNLSQRTEQQASSLEETASGMEELAATIKQNANNCRLASDLATNSSDVAKKGADLVYRVISTM